MNKEIQHWYAHIDLDAFFASVEQLDHPELKGKPVIVGGLPEERRGVVSTASYEARKFGVHSAMPTYQAYKLCPQGIFVHGNYKRYSELSYKIMTIFKDYSPEVNQMSIDEAFIDLTGTEKLFGPPEQTCMNIKERVKKETGLTVSIGLAPTKYIAKICSGYKKPDGFYKVEPGTETDFMLSLPLEKVWGVGEKTLQKLHQKGIFTTRDIYEKDIQTLSFLFGKNTADFLYDVIRGGKNEMFRKETKSHSISSERTFPFDLTDQYTQETEILELAQDVMFRLLKEKGYSRTIFLKLRYDDFTTVSIQKTFDQNIKTLDSFFEQLIPLFEQKKEKDRGIRLIGVGFENVETIERPEQQSLFDDNEKKKQIVENAILKLNQKHPEIKVQKARTLKTTILCLFFSFIFFKAPSLYADNVTHNTGASAILSDTLSSPQKDDLSESLFNIDPADSENFEYNISGFWNMEFEASLLSTFGNNTPFGFSLRNPVFKQKVELSALVLLNKHWYFDTSFADGFEKNTFTIGYKDGGYLNAVQLSNRNIGFTNDYSSSYFGFGLKGGKNQAPGLALQFLDIKNNKWKGDLMIRYDMTNSKEAVFYGMNSVTDQLINIKDYLYGKKYILPENTSSSLGKIKDIYVENPNGEYTDKYKKRYTKLSQTQYSIYKNLCEINFSNDAGTLKQSGKIPGILITFTSDSEVSSIISATGSYNNPSSFAGKIQEYFNSKNSRNIDLSKFSYNLENNIENSKALVLQNSTGFSPYLCAYIYDCGIITTADVSVINQSTELNSNYLSAVEIQENDSLLDDFFYEQHFYAQLLSLESQNSSLQNPQNRYPAAPWNPQVYLGLQSDLDEIIRVRNYSPVSSLQIGTKAVEGSVYVYKNGVIDTGAKYNPDTGSVELSTPFTETDKIVIQYQEDSEDNSGGTLAAGLGFIYNFTPHFYFDSSLTTRLPLSVNEKFATVDTNLYSFTALTNGIYYKNINFQISDKLAVSVQNTNQTGNLLVNSNDNYINQTYYLSATAGYSTKTEPYINEFLTENRNGTVLHKSGIQDSYISGYAIPLEWNFSGLPSDSYTWASTDIKLEAGSLLSNSSYLEFAIKPQFKKSSNTDQFELFLQLGVKADSAFYGENSWEIRTWNISTENSKTSEALDLSSSKWQTVRISLDDQDRALLTSNYDARFVLIRKNGSENNRGRILIGPYQPYVQSIFTKANQNITVQSFSDLTQASPSSSKFNLKKNYSSKLSWQIDKEDKELITADSSITTVTNFEAADFSNYKTINLDFAVQALTKDTTNFSDSNPALTFILDRESSSSDAEGIIALKLTLNDIYPYISETLKYHTLTVNITENEVLIDGVKLEKNTYTLYVNKNVIPSRQKLVFNTASNNMLYTKGNFYINNLYYSETSTYASLQNNFNISYKKSDAVLKIKNYEAVKDISLTVDSKQSYNSMAETSITSSVAGGITFFDVSVQADVNTKYNSNGGDFFIAGAGHNISTAVPLFRFLTFGDNYRFDQESKALSKASQAEINFPKPGIKVSAKADASDSLNLKSQNLLLTQNFSKSIKETTINFNTSVQATQKINTGHNPSKSFNTHNYFEGYKDISSLQFSYGEETADSRTTLYKLSTGLNFTQINLAPALEYSAGTIFTNSTEKKNLYNQNLLFKVPFKIKKYSISLNYNKKASESVLATNLNNYLDDSQALFKNLGDNNYFFKAIPFVELFSTKLPSTLYSHNSKTIYSTYSSKYELEWKRPLLNSIQDMYIPGSIVFALERDTKASDSLSDIYQIKLNINSSAVNNFGTNAKKPLADWFESDEYLSSFTGAVKIPAKEFNKLIYSISWYNQFLIYISKNASINSALDLQIETNDNWNTKATAIYSRPGKTSFLVDLAKFLIPSAQAITFGIIQKDTANIQIGKNTNQYFQQYDYLHTTSLSFLKNYSVNCGLGGTFTWHQVQASSLALTLSLGGKMQF